MLWLRRSGRAGRWQSHIHNNYELFVTTWAFQSSNICSAHHDSVLLASSTSQTLHRHRSWKPALQVSKQPDDSSLSYSEKSLTPLFMLRRGPSVLLRVNTHPCHSLCLYKGGPSTFSCGTLGAPSLILLARWVNARIWGGDRCFVFNPEDMDAAMEWNFYQHVGFSGRHISQLLLVVG